jgi:orotate phosphoribosyltransferase
VDPNLLIGAGSLLFTIIGSIAAVLAVRRSGDSRPIQIVGTVDPKPALRILNRRGEGSRRTEKVVRILARFIFVSHQGRVIVGALDQFHITLFLDLFSAATFPVYRRAVARLIVDHIRGTEFHERPTCVAVPKEGNVLLAAEVARQLKLPIVVVRALVPAIRFGDPIEGVISANSTVILVDDIAYDGELLVRTAAAVRGHGAHVMACFCAVERLDGNSRERLLSHRVPLHAAISLDEGTLRDLAHLPPETAESPVRPDSVGGLVGDQPVQPDV